jgi:hypothetical protein
MGKPLKLIKKGDKLILGMTNKLKNGDFLFFAEIEFNKNVENLKNCLGIEQKLEKFLNYWDNSCYKFFNLIIYPSSYTKDGFIKGYHIISLNPMNEYEILKIWLENINILDRQHISYSIFKKFATIRISKKSKTENLKYIRCFRFCKPPENYKNAEHLSAYHYYILKSIIKDLPTIEYKYLKNYGIEMVGYALDKDKKIGIPIKRT